MMCTKARVVNAMVRFKLKQYLELMIQEAEKTQDKKRKSLLESCCFVADEALTKGTFELIEVKGIPQKYIIVPGIPFEVSQAWVC